MSYADERLREMVKYGARAHPSFYVAGADEQAARAVLRVAGVPELLAENDKLRENVQGEEYLHGCTRADLHEAEADRSRYRAVLLKARRWASDNGERELYDLLWRADNPSSEQVA